MTFGNMTIENKMTIRYTFEKVTRYFSNLFIFSQTNKTLYLRHQIYIKVKGKYEKIIQINNTRGIIIMSPTIFYCFS